MEAQDTHEEGPVNCWNKIKIGHFGEGKRSSLTLPALPSFKVVQLCAKRAPLRLWFLLQGWEHVSESPTSTVVSWAWHSVRHLSVSPHPEYWFMSCMTKGQWEEGRAAAEARNRTYQREADPANCIQNSTGLPHATGNPSAGPQVSPVPHTLHPLLPHQPHDWLPVQLLVAARVSFCWQLKYMHRKPARICGGGECHWKVKERLSAHGLDL